MYDPKIGRFMQIDPLGDLNESWSSYSFVNNNPILLNDPLGLANDSTPAAGDPNHQVDVIVSGCHPCNSPGGPINTAAATAAFPLAMGGSALVDALIGVGVAVGDGLAAVGTGTVAIPATIGFLVVAPGVIWEHYYPTPGISNLPRGINVENPHPLTPCRHRDLNTSWS